jgi:hypothetical protein
LCAAQFRVPLELSSQETLVDEGVAGRRREFVRHSRGADMTTSGSSRERRQAGTRAGRRAAAGLALATGLVLAGAGGAVAADPPGTPRGNFERAVVDADGSVEISGWAVDPDTYDPIYLWVTVDGVGEHVLANEPRDDVGAAYPGHGPDHGFFAWSFFPGGRHTFCVTASNVGPGAHKPLGCRTVDVPITSPLGNLESVQGAAGAVEVKGWALDFDTDRSIYVWLTVDGAGRHVLANKDRPDVEAVYPGYGAAHGFEARVAASPGSHRVCATATNVGDGAHTALGCRSVTVPSASPFGNFEGGKAVAGGVEVRGWAVDPETEDPIFVWVTVDGAGRHLAASRERPDVGAAFPAYGPRHGFAGTIPASPGAHRICVTAANVGAGSHTSLGCRQVTVTG